MGHVILGLVGMIIGIVLIVYSYSIVNRFTGRINVAERILGNAESYDFIRIAGMIITVDSMFILFGWANFISDLILDSLKSMFQ